MLMVKLSVSFIICAIIYGLFTRQVKSSEIEVSDTKNKQELRSTLSPAEAKNVRTARKEAKETIAKYRQLIAMEEDKEDPDSDKIQLLRKQVDDNRDFLNRTRSLLLRHRALKFGDVEPKPDFVVRSS